jgi:DNA-binding MarR family transcriptional regulator
MTPHFDELIHQRARLSIMSLLAGADWAEFSFLRDAVELSDSALSKHLSALEEAGYVVIERVVGDRRRRIRVRLSAEGRRAFEDHVAAVRDIIERAAHTA